MPKNVEIALDHFGKKVVQTARGILNATGKNTSGNLGNSLGYVIKVYPSGSIEIDFVAEGYAKIVDKGIKGSKSSAKAPKSPYQFKKRNLPKGVLDKWAIRKGMKSIRDKKGRFIKRKSLMFLMGRSIALYGIKPSNFFSDAFNEAFKHLPQQIIKSYANDVEKFFDFATKEL